MDKHSVLPFRYDCDRQIISDVNMGGFYGHKTIAVVTSVNHEEDGEFIVEACNNHYRLVSENDRLREALSLILRLAKGYVANNRIGSNRKYLQIAEEALERKRI